MNTYLRTHEIIALNSNLHYSRTQKYFKKRSLLHLLASILIGLAIYTIIYLYMHFPWFILIIISTLILSFSLIIMEIYLNIKIKNSEK